MKKKSEKLLIGKKSTNLFFSGVIILTIANILIKVLGVTLKIPLAHILGDEGMGYYNTAYDIYVWFYMISTAGLPVAISILISESRAKGNIKEAKKIFNITIVVFVIIGLAGMYIMMGGSKLFAKAYEFSDSYIAMLAIAPTLFFICIASAIRGYFQGYQNMVPTAISQIIEAAGKMLFGILFAKIGLGMGYSLPVVAAMTILGTTIAVALGTLYLCLSMITFKSVNYDMQYLREDSDVMECRPTKVLLKNIIKLAIPITISSSVMSFTSMIDGMVLSRRLQSIGYSEVDTLAMFGNYKTLAVPLFNMPPVLIYPISYSVIPLLSAAIAECDRPKCKTIMNSIMKAGALIAFPCSFGLAFMSEPILKLLYPEESAIKAAPLLSVLSLSLFFVAMLSVTNAILQSNKHEQLPIISLAAGSLVKLASSYVLIGIPQINIYGAPLGTFLCYLTICLFNFSFLRQKVRVRPKILDFVIKPMIAGLMCGASAFGFYKAISMIVSAKLATIAAIGLAVIVYIIAVFLLKCIKKEELEIMPKGEKICRVLQKVKLI